MSSSDGYGFFLFQFELSRVQQVIYVLSRMHANGRILAYLVIIAGCFASAQNCNVMNETDDDVTPFHCPVPTHRRRYVLDSGDDCLLVLVASGSGILDEFIVICGNRYS
jgi:hypothetical protein